ncbi:hypothetical protein L6452_30870 [Arctium lappa]|uniref:Uncharacterized protein n=1 Tax=Arctium lappa TaxID=4217 RepID=A0ACB8ZKI5_ARCLA|nr:hypothetical protein L6452_30870 [Arctium lappa]
MDMVDDVIDDGGLTISLVGGGTGGSRLVAWVLKLVGAGAVGGDRDGGGCRRMVVAEWSLSISLVLHGDDYIRGWS